MGIVNVYHFKNFHISRMLNRPVILFIGAAFGLLFLIISIHNSRSLNNDLMEKLVETENDVKSAMTSHENCNRNLESQGTALTQVQQELEKAKNDNLAIKNAMENSRENANQLEDEKQNLMNQNNNLQDQLSSKNQLIEQLQQDKEKAEREVLAAKSALSSQIEKVEEIKKTIIEEYQQKESEKDTVYDENGQLVEDIVVPEENPEEENVAE